MEKEEIEERRMPQLEVEYIINTISWTNLIIIINLIMISKIILPNFLKTQECLNKIS